MYSFKKETGVSKMQLIENIFKSKGRIKVLKKLSQHIGWWFNTTELSQDMGINKGALSKILSELENDNLIIVNRKGRIKLFFISNTIYYYCKKIYNLIPRLSVQSISINYPKELISCRELKK